MIRETNTPKNLPDDDYNLTDGSGWFEVDGLFSVRIHRTDEGVAVDIYKNGEELDGSIASAYAFDSNL
jgi:hypothetical protein